MNCSLKLLCIYCIILTTKYIHTQLVTNFIPFYRYLESESPSSAELNAIGQFLLVYLIFVVFAQIESAFIIILNRRGTKKINGINTEMMSKTNNVDLLPEILLDRRVGTLPNVDGNENIDHQVFIPTQDFENVPRKIG